MNAGPKGGCVRISAHWTESLLSKLRVSHQVHTPIFYFYFPWIFSLVPTWHLHSAKFQPELAWKWIEWCDSAVPFISYRWLKLIRHIELPLLTIREHPGIVWFRSSHLRRRLERIRSRYIYMEVFTWRYNVVTVGHCRRSPMHCADPSLKWSDSFVMNTKKDKNYFVLHSSSNCPEHTDNKFEYLGIYYTWTLVYRGVQKYVIFLARHNNAST